MLDGKGYLPAAFPSPYTGTASKLDEYKLFLQKVDNWAAGLEALIRDGIAVAGAQLKDHPSDAAQKDIIQAVDKLDLVPVADAAPAITEVSQWVNSILQDLLTTLEKDGKGARLKMPMDSPAIGSRTYEQLNLEIRFISLLAWIVLGLLSTLVGTYIVVLSNLGFGLPTDYLMCVFWGFGIPIGGQQIMQLTSASVATTLGISLTK
jgi:hypothetical protein